MKYSQTSLLSHSRDCSKCVKLSRVYINRSCITSVTGSGWSGIKINVTLSVVTLRGFHCTKKNHQVVHYIRKLLRFSFLQPEPNTPTVHTTNYDLSSFSFFIHTLLADIIPVTSVWWCCIRSARHRMEWPPRYV